MKPNEIEHLASQIVQLSREARDTNQLDREEQLLHMAASLELGSPELQNCWGGPLNGQDGRRAIFRELIDTVGFTAILETGTYRGLTTSWFADHFNGPIHTCEIDKRYHYQAVANLRPRTNVHPTLEDSRRFLRRMFSELPMDGRYFAYLDAHWHEDLPLTEEVGIILQSSRECVIAIDDFKVPGDDYQYDDYGEGKILCLELLKDFKDDSIRYFFPRLAASGETGAARGVCVIAKGLAPELGKCQLLQGKTWSEWRSIETAYDMSRRAVPGEDQTADLGNRISTLQTAEATLSKLDDPSAINFGMHNLLKSQDAMHQSVEKFLLSLNDRLEAIDDRRAMGRALVEQKAKNLELERQIFRLNEELAQKSETTVASSPPLHAHRNELIEIKNLADSLARSRMINSMSVVAPNARHTITQLVDRLRRLTDELN